MKKCDCNIYDTTAAPASPLECGPSETNTRVLDSGKNKNKNIENPKVEKHVSSSSSSSEPLSTDIPRRVLMRTYLYQKEICSDVGVENLARGIVHPNSALLDSGANGIFIDQVWAEQIGLPLVKLDVSITLMVHLMRVAALHTNVLLLLSTKDTENGSLPKLPN
ncbi:hypothetical protein SERLA73DRAFT_78314 [Serpula lacrymans var. lacrymans S7.3]|uniref:Uncharacterized protein n=2 Tax=Serpula lacrymans var. lacrymans TaxID=341189 RepID=F8QCR8_SERL3|nr:uncharacterized protein SERLADRAFT_443350 [Serpula lacrymans var. lacrymans S7.9]EGN93933.1 hypothetical protein SERLA73DRAFT_78314 [Serpula lacrymans var. lacrymans S7.3]EGO19304.1 hypothetical protein SERLADRAFT_443350 [Serpula lacrymans var. lacrymans S7.9]